MRIKLTFSCTSFGPTTHLNAGDMKNKTVPVIFSFAHVAVTTKM